MSAFFTPLELAEDQADAETLMGDTCRITRAGDPADQGPIDETTMQYPEVPRVLIYEGPCRLQVKVDINSNVVETTAGDHEWTYLTSQLQVPARSADPRIAAGDPSEVTVDDIAEMLTSEYDPSLVGRLFNIAGPYRKSQATYRRFRVKEVVG